MPFIPTTLQRENPWKMAHIPLFSVEATMNPLEENLPVWDEEAQDGVQENHLDNLKKWIVKEAGSAPSISRPSSPAKRNGTFIFCIIDQYASNILCKGTVQRSIKKNPIFRIVPALDTYKADDVSCSSLR